MRVLEGRKFTSCPSASESTVDRTVSEYINTSKSFRHTRLLFFSLQNKDISGSFRLLYYRYVLVLLHLLSPFPLRAVHPGVKFGLRQSDFLHPTLRLIQS